MGSSKVMSYEQQNPLVYERFCSLDILENAADRRTTENRSDLMAIYCDLIDDLFKLEENNIQVVCVLLLTGSVCPE